MDPVTVPWSSSKSPQTKAKYFRLDVLSKKSVGIHYGTFILTTEPIDDPVKKLDIARQKYGLDINDFSDSKLGKIIKL